MASALVVAALFLFGLGPSGGTGSGAASGAQDITAGSIMLARASGPIELGTTPVRVTLETVPGDKSGAKSLAALLDAVTPGQHLYLVLKGLSAEISPRTPYGVYVNLPPNAPNADPSAETLAARLAGRLTFFNEVRSGVVEPGAPAPKTFRSFDITKMLDTLDDGRGLTEGVTVTLIPERKGVVSAKATIDSIELVAR